MSNKELIGFYKSEGFRLIEQNMCRYQMMAIEL